MVDWAGAVPEEAAEARGRTGRREQDKGRVGGDVGGGGFICNH